MLDDIRDTPPEQYWEVLRQRWGALLTYRYIGRQYSSMNAGANDDTVVLRRDMRNGSGGLLASVLSCCAPGGGGPSDLEVVPNPVIHSLQVIDAGRDVKRIAIQSETLKVGTRMYYGRATVVDADDPTRTIGFIQGQGASIGDVPAGMDKFDDDPVMHIEDSPDLPPLWQVFGGSRRDDGHWTLRELQAEFASPDAALHVGPQFVIFETAALQAAAGNVAPDRLQTESCHVMFMARGKVGPFRVDAEVGQGHDDSGRLGVQLTLHDEGNGDRAISAATVVVDVVD